MPEHKLSEDIIPESRLVIEKIRGEAAASGDENEYRKSEYGHALLSLAYGIEMGSLASSPEKQKEFLRYTALKVIEKMGPNIIPLMPEELRAVLTDEELSMG